ncbi:MAG: carboxypeptidase-like regulatory domain-containing protein [Euryarchaeota archaeon]|nr:carboxypeptidase-like regulatory domain-containing protein [Euryarchaeota archaeon]
MQKIEKVLSSSGRKVAVFFLVALFIFASGSTIFVNMAQADGEDFTNFLGFQPQMINVTIDDTFNTSLDVVVAWEINNITVRNLTFLPTEIINYLSTAQGTIFTDNTFIQPEDANISNTSGYVFPFIWINTSGVNNTGLFANISWHAVNVGMAFINFTGTTANDSGVNYTTITRNVTVIVHPQGPSNSSFNAVPYNSTQIDLNFTKRLGADNTIIVRNTHIPESIMDGALIYNDTGSSYQDTGLSLNTTYYYRAISWNQTANIYSIEYANATASTTDVNITIIGQVKDSQHHDVPLPSAEIRVMKNGQCDICPDKELHYSDESGNFNISVTESGPGYFSIEIARNGYVGYGNWNFELDEGDIKDLGVIYLEPLFGSQNNSMINGTIKNETGAPINGASVMLLDTNFSHLLKGMEGVEDIGKETTTNEAGYYNFTIAYRSTYRVIAFFDGYYANLSENIIINDPNQIENRSFNMSLAAPDTLDLTVHFTDLDDAIVTVNRTIVAGSKVFRFSLDIDPNLGGDGNQNVSQTELANYLDYLNKDGPGFKSFSEDGNGGSGKGNEGNGPLEIPVSMYLDNSTLSEFVSGSHNGIFDNLVTTVDSNQTIYYNATFSITLDGPILNQTLHALNITTVFNTTINCTINFDFGDFYNINDNNSNISIITGSVTNTTHTLYIFPGSGDSEALVNVSLEFNGTLPIIEIPTWHITDRWTFDQDGTPVTYTVTGKPLQEYDADRYRVGDESVSYICYQIDKVTSGEHNVLYVTMSDLAWVNVSEQNVIDYLVGDVDFPIYNGKTWQTTSWWGEQVNATVINCSDLKLTQNDTFSSVKINYTNATDETETVGQEWYSPDVNFFVNRTRYVVDDEIDTALNLTSYSHAPFIESCSISPRINDSNSLIDSLDATVIINTSRYYDGPSDYVLEGPLYKETQNGVQTDIVRTRDENTLRNLDTGNCTKTVNISYSGSIINASGIDGPYSGFLELREAGGQGPSQRIDYTTFETETYSYTDFQSPAVTILLLSDDGNDTNGNGEYNYLTANVTLNIIQTGNYTINAGLNSAGMRREWITGTGMGRRSFTQGETPIITLNFDGTEIYTRGYDSPYIINLEVWNDDTHTIVVQNESEMQNSYSATDFEPPTVYFDRTYMAQNGLHDYVNNGIYLTVNVSITVADSAFSGGTQTYDLHSGLCYTQNDQYVTGSGSQITLHENENIIPLNFNVGEIYQKNPTYNGTFTVHMGLSQSGPDIDNSNYVTASYNLSNPLSFPPPPITMTIDSSAVTDSGNYLTIFGNVSISSETYANTTYDFHGGVNWIEGEMQIWHSITGMGQQRSFINGSNPFIINFSGTEISASNQNGPYKIWLGIEGIPNHERIASVEYTANFNASNFTAPGILFNESNTTAYIVPGSDYLTIQTSLLVNTPGTYRINGGINWVQHMTGWDNWVFITGTGNDYLLTENTNKSFEFDQGMIKTALQNSGQQSCVLKVQLNIENITTWQTISHLEYATQPYSVSNFTSSAVTINSTASSIVDGNLVVNLTYYALQGDQYTLNGGVNTQAWSFITGTWSQPILSLGEHSINITFDGGQIYSSGQNGPYRIWIGIENKTTHRLIANNEFMTDLWSYTQFSTPAVQILRANMTTGSCDYMNASASGSYLTVNVTLNASVSGTYWLDGGLNYIENNNRQWITGTGGPVTLLQGANIIPLNFNAGDIYSSGKSGQYRVSVGLRNRITWQDIDHYDYTTKSYTAGQLPAPPIQFETMSAGDPSYGYINGSYFTVNVSVNVTSSSYAGTYDLHGGVAYRTGDGWQHLTGTGNWVQLVNGINNKTLNFNAGEIRTGLPGGYNNNLSVWIGLSNTTTWTEITHIEYITQMFDSSLFPEPDITLSGTGDYVNGSSLTVNITINAEYAGEYDVNGGINWIDISQGGENMRFITGSGSMQQLSVGANNIAFNFNAGDIYNTLLAQGYTGKLAAWISVQNMTTREQLAHLDYRTSNEYSIGSFSPPDLIINCTGDYNNETDYLTINVTLNATGSSLNTIYDIHAGIHWQQGREWMYITGYGTTVNVTENMTIPINFNGGSIRISEHDGPYQVWVGISTPGNWQDIAHDQYTTGTYNYIDFAAPPVQILSSNLTDYANSTTYLTVNVTVSATQTGVYFLEGGLHWKDGIQWKWITCKGTEINITEIGNSTIPLNFDGKQIARAAQDGWTGGYLVAWITIRNITTWSEINRINEYTTQRSYSPSDFTEAPITFNGTIIDSGSEDFAPLTTQYNSLKVIVPLNITQEGQSGNYKIYASLYDPVNKTFIVAANSSNITGSVENATLLFNGTRINNTHYNGTFEFRAKIIDLTNKYECDRMVNITSSYTYDQFIGASPDATIIGNYTNYTSGEYLIVNITIHINSTRQYELYGDLFNSTTTYITNARNSTFENTSGQDVNVSLKFNRSAINSSSVSSPPYKLAYLRLSVKNEADNIWDELETTNVNDYYIQGSE